MAGLVRAVAHAYGPFPLALSERPDGDFQLLFGSPFEFLLIRPAGQGRALINQTLGIVDEMPGQTELAVPRRAISPALVIPLGYGQNQEASLPMRSIVPSRPRDTHRTTWSTGEQRKSATDWVTQCSAGSPSVV